jgi:hypothetical protein
MDQLPSVKARFFPRIPCCTVALALALTPGAFAQEPELPRPLLDVGSTRNALPQPAPAIPSAALEDLDSLATATAGMNPVASPTPDPLATIRMLRQWRRDNPAPVVDSPTGTAIPTPFSTPMLTASPTPAATPIPTTRADLTLDQVKAWNDDARSLLRNNQKPEAKAMFQKVWESDPENKFGMSDMAYIQWCGLIVSSNDDGLRREALARISEFDQRFPNSPHKDSAVFIRATLATDLGKVDEAHRLLQDFAERFPNSRRNRDAFDLLRSLPPLPGDRRLTPAPAPTRSSTGSSARSENAPRSSTPRPPATTRQSSLGTPRGESTPTRRIRSAYDQATPSTGNRTTRPTPRPSPRSSNPVRSTPRP